MEKQPQYIILYVDDEPSHLELFRKAFYQDFQVVTASSGQEGLQILEKQSVSLILSDHSMPQMTGIDFLKKSVSLSPHATRIILSAYSDKDILLKALNSGEVFDYVLKPWKRTVLKEVIEKGIRAHEIKLEKIKKLESLEDERDYLRREIKHVYDVEGIIGARKGLQAIMDKIPAIAKSSSPVFIRGESGTGKELIARAIHNQSDRNNKPFVKLRVAMIDEDSLDREIFGTIENKGLIEMANGGTVFFDEISELPLNLQKKLLSTILEKEIPLSGSPQTRLIDIHIIAATNRPIEKLIEKGEFRRDLFYRLNVFPLTIPPLRERKEDIPYLMEHFLAKFNKEFHKALTISEEALTTLRQYEWKGNVRELKDILERAVALATSSELKPPDFSFNASTPGHASLSEGETNFMSEVRQTEIENLKQQIKEARGNISEAARRMKLPISTLYHRLKKYGLIDPNVRQ
jgi:DNA-binding NtrC family response regulator